MSSQASSIPARGPCVGLAGPRRLVVSRAEALIRARPDATVSARELAGALGVSVRSLFRAFEQTRGYGPKEARLRIRLEHVRAELRAGAPGATVTEIALGWGFGHLGRFAALYQRYFGEKPSETLRARTAS